MNLISNFKDFFEKEDFQSLLKDMDWYFSELKRCLPFLYHIAAN